MAGKQQRQREWREHDAHGGANTDSRSESDSSANEGDADRYACTVADAQPDADRNTAAEVAFALPDSDKDSAHGCGVGNRDPQPDYCRHFDTVGSVGSIRLGGL